MSYNSDQRTTGSRKASGNRTNRSSQKKGQKSRPVKSNQGRRNVSSTSQRNQRQPYDENRKRSSSRRRSVRRRQKNSRSKWLLFAVLLVILIVLLFVVVKGCAKDLRETLDPTVWSKEVVDYRPLVEEKAAQYGIEDYTDILLSIMMQESKGKGTDPMQSSECIYNTQYGRVPGGIEDPVYSIECGVQYFSDALREAGCEGLNDTNALMLAIQGYNYGHGYISWALENYGGYSKENAEYFSEQLKEELGWSAYGDPEYVVKVMNYYYASSEKIK